MTATAHPAADDGPARALDDGRRHDHDREVKR